ncbi:aminotransferase class IV-domain-containing protein [Geopyxis carbonaria]|nr:aminotransferase class IV-domain-containing protein [Geopyxis carbonaria]
MVTSSETPFTIFTSIRYDPQLLPLPRTNQTASDPEIAILSDSPYYLLPKHLSRLRTAAEHFSFPESALSLLTPINLLDCLNSAISPTPGSPPPSNPLKFKVILSSSHSSITVQTTTIPRVTLASLYPTSLPLPDPNSPWRVVLDSRPTSPTQFTTYKTSVREIYDEARARAGIKGWSETREVLLWNENEEVMEGSFTNVSVQRDGEWITARSGAGGLDGICRNWLLEGCVVREAVEGELKVRDVEVGEWVVLSNGVRGVWGAWVEARVDNAQCPDGEECDRNYGCEERNRNGTGLA